MQVYMYIVRIPEHVWEERDVSLVDTKSNDVLLWTVKELNRYYSGEFSWEKMNVTFGVCARQYINRRTVRILVNSPDIQASFEMIKSYSWHLDAKKFHKRTYAPRQPKSAAKKAA